MDNIQERIVRQAQAISCEVFEVGLDQARSRWRSPFSRNVVTDMERGNGHPMDLLAQISKRGRAQHLHPSQGRAFSNLGR